MQRIDTLLLSMESNDILDDYITNIIDSKPYEDFRLTDDSVNSSLKIALAKYIILSIKEEIIIKPKNATYTNNLLFSAIDSLVNKIGIVHYDGTVTVNNYTFPDGNTLVAGIRNKFAHGDYAYSNDYKSIIFNFDNNDVVVSLDSMYDFALSLFAKHFEYKDTDEQIKPYGLITGLDSRNPLRRVTDIDFERVLNSFVLFTFVLKSSNGNITKEAYEHFDKVKETIDKTVAYYRDDSFEKVLPQVFKKVNEFIEYFNNKSVKNGWNVELTYDSKKLDDNDRTTIKDNFLKMKGNYPTTLETINELPAYIIRQKCDDYNRLAFISKCSNLMVYLYFMQLSGKTDLKILANYAYDFMKKSIVIDQDVLAIVKILKLLDICYYMENFDLDYSLLPLDIIKPTISVVSDNELDNAIDKADADERKVKSFDEQMQRIVSQLAGVKKSNMISETKQGVLKTLDDLLSQLEQRKSVAMMDLNNSSELAYSLIQDREDNKDYHYKRHIIGRIRDSISHGNVYIIPNGKIPDTIIRFEDTYNDQTIFLLEISLGELSNILDGCFEVLYKKENIKR